MKKILVIWILLFFSILVSCSSSEDDLKDYSGYDQENDSESYLELKETGYINTETNNKVNVSMDSSNAAYSNVRRLINKNVTINPNSVNIEQMLNYFNYSYVNDSDKALKVFTEVSDCPWNSDAKLLSLVVKAKEIELNNTIANNFVFLLDVSGSMYADNKLPLMINAFKLLIDNLNDNDRVSIVTYAGNEKVLLDGGYGYEKPKISAIISDLAAGGSTHGSKGIKTAYELASKHFIQGGNNRVFLATDGDFNVGIYGTNELKSFISDKRQTGVYLSLFGFGEGNLKASTMDTLAQAGNGNYYYIDSILEAQKVFVSELGGTLNTIAKDCKTQVEFNKEVVEKYRVIGFENKILSDEEFEDNETDAGEIGAGHTTICLIEFILKTDAQIQEILKCTVRFKDPIDEISQEIVATCDEITEMPTDDYKFASAVAEFGLLLRNSNFKGTSSYENILTRVNNQSFTTDPYKKEFCDLVLNMRNRQQ